MEELLCKLRIEVLGVSAQQGHLREYSPTHHPRDHSPQPHEGIDQGGRHRSKPEVFFPVDGHVAHQNVGIPGYPEPNGDKTQKRPTAKGRWVQEGSILGRHLRDHDLPSTHRTHRHQWNQKERTQHEHRLNRVRQGDRKEPTHRGVEQDDQGGEEHTDPGVHPKPHSHGLAASSKLRSHVGRHEDEDDPRENHPEPPARVSKDPDKDVRERDPVHALRRSPQAASQSQEEEALDCRVTHHSPDGAESHAPGHPSDPKQKPGTPPRYHRR